MFVTWTVPDGRLGAQNSSPVLALAAQRLDQDGVGYGGVRTTALQLTLRGYQEAWWQKTRVLSGTADRMLAKANEKNAVDQMVAVSLDGCRWQTRCPKYQCSVSIKTLKYKHLWLNLKC